MSSNPEKPPDKTPEKTHRKSDLVQVARYLDGELPVSERAALEARLHREPALQAALEAAREQRAWIAGADPARDLAHAPAGLVDSVMQQVRGMPSRDELRRMADGEDLLQTAAATGRRVLVAASLLFAVGLLVSTSLLQPTDDGTAEASGQEITRLREKAKTEKRKALLAGKEKPGNDGIGDRGKDDGTRDRGKDDGTRDRGKDDGTRDRGKDGRSHR